jgi:hypothetical protein
MRGYSRRLPAQPGRCFLHRLLVELDAELHVRALGDIVGVGEVVVFETDKIVAGADPDVGNDLVADRGPAL